jgi:hypothetical protein
MKNAPRLSIELKTQGEIDLKTEAHSKAIAKKTSLREIILKALVRFCSEN